MKKPILVMACAGLLCSPPAAALDPFARELGSVEEGNRSYSEQHFDQALDLYERAEQEVVQEPRVHFNRGAALFKLGRPKEAREAYLRASGATDPRLKKQNYYNIGNTFLAEGAFHDAVPYYRRALEIDPGFDDARFNLELALQAIRQQQQQQQQQQDGQSDRQDRQEGQDQKKDKDQEKDREEEGSQDQGKDQQEKKDQQQGDQQQQQEQQQEQEQKDQNQQDRGDQEDRKDREGEQEKEKDQEQPGQPQQGQEDRPGEEDQQEQPREQQPGQPRPRPEKIPGQLSRAEFRDLLDSMRDSEKPFQMHKFELPEYRQQRTEKDW